MPLILQRHHRYRRLVSALLIHAFVLMMLFPVHYHLQHHGDKHDDVVVSQSHSNVVAHTVNIHPQNSHPAATHHADSHVIDPGTELGKPGTLKLPPFVIALVLALLLPVIDRSCRYRLMRAIALSVPSFRYHLPLLRAPPRVC
ncbi:MAG: hypothetical protein IBX49_08050 [Gammaproteobacteria bacterium]|nr:hypothetical protein [Gammaproteobacteria bacterium]